MTLYSQVPCPLSVCSPVNLLAETTVLIPAPSTCHPGLSTEKCRCNSQILLMEPNPCHSQLQRRRVDCEEWLQTSNCRLASLPLGLSVHIEAHSRGCSEKRGVPNPSSEACCLKPNVLLWDQLLKAPSSSQRTRGQAFSA